MKQQLLSHDLPGILDSPVIPDLPVIQDFPVVQDSPVLPCSHPEHAPVEAHLSCVHGIQLRGFPDSSQIVVIELGISNATFFTLSTSYFFFFFFPFFIFFLFFPFFIFFFSPFFSLFFSFFFPPVFFFFTFFFPKFLLQSFLDISQPKATIP